MLRSLWADRDAGGFSIALAKNVLHFNGKLFKGSAADGYSLLLTPDQIDLLIAAAQANWREVEPAEAAQLGNLALIRDYRNGRDLTDTPRGVKVIDAFGLTSEQLRQQFPAVYQWLLDRVKPERDQNNRATYRDNWWIFGEARKDLRPALAKLPRSTSPPSKLPNTALSSFWMHPFCRITCQQ